MDIQSKYTLIVPLKFKKGIVSIKLTNSYQKTSGESNRKPSKILMDKGSYFTIDQ